MTKSSNKSVLNDAIDTRDTADTLGARWDNSTSEKFWLFLFCTSSSHVLYRKQCDEDDYGFASKTSQVGFLLKLDQRDEGLNSGFV